ncbi:MAG TPA: translation initiation factor IF-3 [Prolixibacteraceae bacterium]|nr:translation initiation factor IF-3 [Prolixibacteraceae bacterium]
MAIKRRGGGRSRFVRRDRGPQHKINEKITSPQIRLVGDNIEEQGVYPVREALKMADQMDLDLVEISPSADPPVCKIIDYSKFLYKQKKKQKEMKQNAVKVVVKEIRFGPHTDEHDFEFKMRHGEKFLKDGAKVKAYVFFKGRSILFKEQGEILLLKLATALEDLGTVEQMPKLEGKRMTMIISPKKK